MSEQVRVALVTGGNRGIGFEICEQLGSQSIHIVLTSRDAKRGAEASDKLARAGIRAESLDVDVCVTADLDRLVEHIRERHGGLDILVNNAGVAMSGFDEEVVRTTMATNFFAPLELSDRLLPLMRSRGRIVMVSSGMGERSFLPAHLAQQFDGQMSRDSLIDLMNQFIDDVASGTHEERGWPSSAYRMSKIALNKITEILAAELTAAGDDRQILVNAACPGWVRTDMGGPHAPRTPAEGADTPVWLALLGEDGPQGGFFRDRSPVDW